jgi:hypothetical protein
MKIHPSQFLKEDNGNLSSSRLFAFLVSISAIIDWQHAVWTVGRWTPDWQTVGVILGVVGVKTVQKFAEAKTNGQNSEGNHRNSHAPPH